MIRKTYDEAPKKRTPRQESISKRDFMRNRRLESHWSVWDEEQDEFEISVWYIAFEEEDGSIYADEESTFTIWMNTDTGKYFWTSSALDERSDRDFDTEEQAFKDAKRYHTPDDGSKLLIDDTPFDMYESYRRRRTMRKESFRRRYRR